MQTSSDSISQLAAALAKAQAELVNPIKSLTAVLERGRNGLGPISYRYAPLSAGLDILRKTLSKHELATIQTTRIDPDRGFVLLTTTIAHSSGEWMSGIWPVCQISDMGHPKLMGAALTYARRYCLFTLVGLAGEDDIDGPPLEANDNLPTTKNHSDTRIAEAAASRFQSQQSVAETVQERLREQVKKAFLHHASKHALYRRPESQRRRRPSDDRRAGRGPHPHHFDRTPPAPIWPRSMMLTIFYVGRRQKCPNATSSMRQPVSCSTPPFWQRLTRSGWNPNC